MLPPGVTPNVEWRTISSRNLDTAADENLWKWKLLHSIGLVSIVFTYGFSLTMIDGDRTLLSGAWREILQELHPDEPKDAERLIEGEVVPKWGEVLHADDVSKQLNWFQTFCRNKYGMDDHLEFYWRCNIFDTTLQWDESKPALDTHMNCSKAFVNLHIRRGDNPLCVPYGKDSLPKLQKLVEAEGQGPSFVGEISEIYDEYTVREGSPMFEFLDEAFEDVDEKLTEIEEALAKGDGEDARRLQTTPLLACKAKEDGCTSLADGTYGQHYPHLNVQPESEVPCHCFYTDNNGFNTSTGERQAVPKVVRTCRNHHWGLFLLCQPERVSVQFFIERIKPKRLVQGVANEQEVHQRRLFWFSVTMEFTKLQGVIDQTAGWYRTNLKLEEGEFYGYKTVLEGIIGVAAGLLICFLLIRDLLWTVVLLPRNMKHLWSIKDIHAVNARLARQEGRNDDAITITADLLAVRFEKRLLKVCDGRGHRRKFMSMIECVMENLAAFCAVCGIVSSMGKFFSSSIPTKYAEDKVSPKKYIIGSLSGQQMLIELVYETLFDNTSWHGFAWFVLYFRTLGLFLNSMNGTKWLPTTILLAWIRSFYFMVFFAFLLTGFAILAYIQFGQRFLQFSTVTRSVLELSFLTCGVPSAVFDDMYPFQERNALLACTYLAVFLILAVTIGMNFFTTILLDAYNIALDPSAAEEILAHSWATILKGMMKAMGVPLEQCAKGTVDDFEDEVPGRRPGDGEASEDEQIELVTRRSSENIATDSH